MADTLHRLTQTFQQPCSGLNTTLLNLVWRVSQTTDGQQVAATVAQLVNSGQVQLTGTFKHTRQIRV